MVEGQKMSKSSRNLYTLEDLAEKGYKPQEVRYLLLSGNYRQPLNFTFDSLGAPVRHFLNSQTFPINSK